LKAAADAAGRAIYLELSSVNPVVVLPGVLNERGPQLAEEFASSCLMGTGQFCTNPGLVLLVQGEATEAFVREVAERFQAAPVGTLLSRGVETSLQAGLKTLRDAGAQVVTGDTPGGGLGYSHANTLLRVSGSRFLDRAEMLQTEAFGNCSLLVIADDMAQLEQVIERLEGSLTGCVYTETGGADDAAYDRIAPRLRQRVGRLLNDKMPTGVAVSPAMNHGGPYPATGHPGFTAVGIPASLRRFAALHGYDNVRPHRLPQCLQDKNPNAAMWRLVDGRWTQGDVHG
jgi:NADP-dependent aldehyde dehydrogenase